MLIRIFGVKSVTRTTQLLLEPKAKRKVQNSQVYLRPEK